VSSSGKSSGGELPIPIIAGGAGGVVLFLIILLCVIIVCVRCSRKKKLYAINTVFVNTDGEIDSKGTCIKYIHAWLHGQLHIGYKKSDDGLGTLAAHNALYCSVEADRSMNNYEMSEVLSSVLFYIIMNFLF